MTSLHGPFLLNYVSQNHSSVIHQSLISQFPQSLISHFSFFSFLFSLVAVFHRIMYISHILFLLVCFRISVIFSFQLSCNCRFVIFCENADVYGCGLKYLLSVSISIGRTHKECTFLYSCGLKIFAISVCNDRKDSQRVHLPRND
jgi:hypothetical protein